MAQTALAAVAPDTGVTVLCSSPDHPIFPLLDRWAVLNGAALVSSPNALSGGDFLFLISCGDIIPAEVRARFRHVLVIHASDLPKERGWSPHIWAIVEGRSEITVTLLSAADPVDSGDIWHHVRFNLVGTETCDEINARLFAAEIELMDWALAHCEVTEPRPQQGVPSFRRRRTPEDSRIDPTRPLAEAFDLLRVCDPARFPAFFDYRGQRYVLEMRKA